MKLLQISFVLLFIVSIGFNVSSQEIDNDPFAAYRTGKAPAIIKKLGIDTTNSGIIVDKLVFHSRDITSADGKAEVSVFAAIAHPKGTGPFPGVLRLHGGGGKADINVAESLAQDGYVAMVLDIPGISHYGGNHHPETSWPKQETYGVTPDITHGALFTGIVASLQAFYLLKAQPDIDKNKIGIAGGSWGGYIATMLAAMLDDDLAATWSVYGTGNFMAGSFGMQMLNKMSDYDRFEWIKYLDPGQRAANITKPFGIITATNDKHWSWMAVQKTLSKMKGETFVSYAPNEDHKISYPGSWKMMEFFNYYLKNAGPPIPKVIESESHLDKNGNLHVKLVTQNAAKPEMVNIFYSDPSVKTTERKWIQVEAKRENDGIFSASVANAAFPSGVDWYASMTDRNTSWTDQLFTTSTWIKHLKSTH
ncbi:alpha/beta hydrolase family protein [Parapedobacter deserti]|uniref:Alpha/beta hydrolase family protein n=1 Tax=Parapedobacter deserti TaxID=1912957 RepID=A0ABV7JLL6_9SPHI